MMGIVLFAIIGAKLNMGAGFWICYGVLTFIKVIDAAYKVVKDYTNS